MSNPSRKVMLKMTKDIIQCMERIDWVTVESQIGPENIDFVDPMEIYFSCLTFESKPSNGEVLDNLFVRVKNDGTLEVSSLLYVGYGGVKSEEFWPLRNLIEMVHEAAGVEVS